MDSMDTPNQTTSAPPVAPPAAQPVQAPQAKKPSKLPLIIIALLVIIIIFLGGYFVMNEMSKRNPAQTPNPTPVEKLQATSSPEPTTEAKEMKSFSSPKLENLSFKGYSLKHPVDWTEKYERDNNVGTAKLTLTKDDYSIIIQQGPMGGAICIYEGTLPEGPANDLRGKTFVDIKTAFGNLRRTDEQVNGKTAYSYCQENEQEAGTYGSFTSIGALSVSAPTTPDKAVLSEIDDILKSIQTL